MAKDSRFAHGRSEIHERKALGEAIRRERRRLGERLRELRTERELTQAQAAELIGVHPVHVARVETGSANITLATMTAFALAYDVHLNELFPVKMRAFAAVYVEEPSRGRLPDVLLSNPISTRRKKT